MRMREPSYHAIIPANVRYDNRLSANEKLMYGELTCLSNKYGYCWATNAYFANLYNVSIRTIQRWLENLEKCEYIFRDTKQVSKDDKERKIYIINNKDDKNVIPPYDKNVLYNNINNNNINTNVSHSQGECPLTPFNF